MVNKKMTNRDYLRVLITRINKEAGITYNSSKLNSVKECEEYILKLVARLKKDNGAKALTEVAFEVGRYTEQIEELENKLNIAESALNKAENKVIELSNADNCKALYDEIDELKETIQFKNMELSKLDSLLFHRNEEIEFKNKEIKKFEEALNFVKEDRKFLLKEKNELDESIKRNNKYDQIFLFIFAIYTLAFIYSLMR